MARPCPIGRAARARAPRAAAVAVSAQDLTDQVGIDVMWLLECFGHESPDRHPRYLGGSSPVRFADRFGPRPVVPGAADPGFCRCGPGRRTGVATALIGPAGGPQQIAAAGRGGVPRRSDRRGRPAPTAPVHRPGCPEKLSVVLLPRWRRRPRSPPWARWPTGARCYPVGYRCRGDGGCRCPLRWCRVHSVLPRRPCGGRDRPTSMCWAAAARFCRAAGNGAVRLLGTVVGAACALLIPVPRRTRNPGPRHRRAG